MKLPENIGGYCQQKGLRILCVDAFRFFMENLANLPGNYLEIGVFEGYALRELALAYPDKTFYGIDPFIEDGNTTGHNDGVAKGDTMWKQMEIAHRNFKDVPNIKFFQQTSRSWFAEMEPEDLAEMNIGAVLVDGDHSYDAALHDLNIAGAILANGGVIYVDDTGLPLVSDALFEWCKKMPHITGFECNGHALIQVDPKR